MIKVDSFTDALVVGTALFLLVGVTLPARALAQTPGQGQAVGILLLLGLGARPGMQAPAESKKPDGVARKAARTAEKPAPPSESRMAGRSVEVPDGARAKPSAPRPTVRTERTDLLAARH
jgi:hypothetical protein